MEYQNVNPPNILHVAVGAQAPQHGSPETPTLLMLWFVAELEKCSCYSVSHQ
jgi:hypothetical protein